MRWGGLLRSKIKFDLNNDLKKDKQPNLKNKTKQNKHTEKTKEQNSKNPTKGTREYFSGKGKQMTKKQMKYSQSDL